jgi:hypothetical protein
MKIYLLTQNQNRGWDTYDSCVVVASSPEEARLMHPEGERVWDGREWIYANGTDPSLQYLRKDWAYHPDNVTFEEIGTANGGDRPRVVCASYNAG